MNIENFNQIVSRRFAACEAVLVQKGDEYATESDRLHNFKKAGRIKGQDPVQALDGMWLKHLVSIDDIIERMINDPLFVPDQDLMREKLGDNINYTVLLEGLIEDRRASLPVV